MASDHTLRDLAQIYIYTVLGVETPSSCIVPCTVARKKRVAVSRSSSGGCNYTWLVITL
jgi:hypothetical protein